MKQVDLDFFDREVTCTYRDETYRVRDNGKVFRCRRNGSRLRPLDEKMDIWPREQDDWIHAYSIHTGSPDRCDGFPRSRAIKGSCRGPR